MLVLYAMALPVLEEEGEVNAKALRENYRELALLLAKEPGQAVGRALEA